MRAKHAAPLFTFVALLIVYSLTLAPGVTLWDAGEFLAAIKTLGIPHPAGTSFYVLVARCWSFLFAPMLGFARSVNLFSAVATAAAAAMITALFSRWTKDNRIGICAGVLSGLMSTIWLSATETEVYGLAMLLGVVLLAAADRSGTSGESRWTMLVAYLAGLAWSLHLSSLVVMPAALLLAFTDRDGGVRLPRGRRRHDGRSAHHSPLRLALYAIPLVVLGASGVLFLLIRARHDPAINQGNPSTVSALWDVLTRKQYGARSLWPRSAPLYLQIGNLFQYADWQLALGVSGDPGPAFWRTIVTVIYAVLGAFGCAHHRRIDRRSWRAWVLLLATASLGVIFYLNMKAGPSYGHGIVADHEARERDYFFFFVFAGWAAWAAVGAVRLTKRLPAALASVPFVIAALPVVLNWSAVNRSSLPEDVTARANGLAMIEPLPQNAVMLAVGDNDTYPLWYLQQVEGVRRDVTVVTVPLLSASWYRAELARRNQLLDAGAPMQWTGEALTLASIRSHAAALGRPVVPSSYYSRVVP